MQELNIYYPFSPSKEIDPRHVFSVADQVISEYIFGFFAQESYKRGLVPVLSGVMVDRKSKSVTLTLNKEIKLSDGAAITTQYICNAVEAFFKGTLHAKLERALNKIECNGNEITIRLNYVPVNIDALFSTTDFSIYDTTQLPIKGKERVPTTGPYYVLSLDAKKASLARNPFYPADLTANSIEKVNLHWQNTVTDEFLADLNSAKVNAFYAFGFLLNQEKINAIKRKGFNVEQFPSEWMVYLGFNERMSLDERKSLSKVVDDIRGEVGSLELGQTAYSISPSDRDFGLGKSDYLQTTSMLSAGSIQRKLRIGIFSEYIGAPIFDAYVSRLKSKLGSNFELVVYDRTNVRKIFSNEVDAFFSVLGITPADPLTHFSFLQDTQANFRQLIDTDSLEKLSMIEDSSELNRELIDFEKRVIANRLMVPLAHFPGVIAHSSQLKRREDLAWSWGIQAWTLEMR